MVRFFRGIHAVFFGLIVVVLLVTQATALVSAQPDWIRVPPETSGFERDLLTRAYETARDLPRIESLLVSRRGNLVVEAYFDGTKPEDATNIKSASKTVLSALVGVALREGHLDGIEQRIGPFFPSVLKGHPKKQDITIEDLLLMRSGLQSTSFEQYGAWVISDNWVKYALEQPLLETPGTETRYSTGNSHILSVVLTKVVGEDLLAYARRKLFDPLNATVVAWQKDPQGFRFGGNNMSMRPKAMLKFGQLYLNDGTYGARRILSESWVDTSTRQYVFDTYHGYPYGYFWWTTHYREQKVNFAWGHGGQFIFVVPSLDLVVVTTADLNDKGGEEDHLNERIHDLLKDYVIPSAL